MAIETPPASPPVDPEIASTVIARAERLLIEALRERSPAERDEAEKLGGLVNDEAGKAFTLAMVDQVFRSGSRRIQAKRWRGLITHYGVPAYLPFLDRVLLRLGAIGSRYLPGFVMPQV